MFFCTFVRKISQKMKIFAIGMNYAAHNQELHGTLKRPDEPVIFTKADSAILNQGKPFFIPDHLGRIDYETEVVVRICRLGKNIPERFEISRCLCLVQYVRGWMWKCGTAVPSWPSCSNRMKGIR